MIPPRVKSVWSRLFFSWVTPFIRANEATPLTLAGVPQLPADYEAARAASLLKLHLESSSSSSLTRALFSLLTRQIVRSALLSAIGLSAGLASPLLLRQLLLSLSGQEPNLPTWLHRISEAFSGGGLGDTLTTLQITLALAMSLVSLVSIFTVHHLFNGQLKTAVRTRTALAGLVYQKALKLRRAERLQHSGGFLINLVGADSQKIQMFLITLHSSLYHPLLVISVVYVLYLLVGTPALWGTLAMVALLGALVFVARAQARARTLLSEATDARVSLIREALTHVKAVKYQAREEVLAERVDALRSIEFRHSSFMMNLVAIHSFLAGSGPAVGMLVMLTGVVLSGRLLDASIVFPALALFMNLRFALNQIPETVSNGIESFVALRRIKDFLRLPESTEITIDRSMEGAIRVSGARFEWECGVSAFELGELSVRRGELVAVVGAIGSGKSALLQGLIGELRCSDAGAVVLGDTVAYVPDTPWIVSDTLRNNILLGQPLDGQRYARAVAASGLAPDIALLADGDLTEIGERGVNLSGGQRQRVALARAAYRASGIVLMDDPLSALDPPVAEQVFSGLILGELSNTTRVMITHRLQYALRADRVLVVERGKIVEDGPPALLRERGPRFREMLRHTAQRDAEEHTRGETSGHEIISASGASATAAEGIETESGSLTGQPDRPDSSGITVAEELDRGAVWRSTIVRYALSLAPGPLHLGLVTLGGLFLARQGFVVGGDLWIAHSAQNGLQEPARFLTVYFALTIGLCVTAVVRSRSLFMRALRAGFDAHRSLLRGIFGAPLRFFESNPVGRILNRFSSDISTIETVVPRTILDTLHCLIEVLFLIMLVAWAYPPALLALVPLILCYYRIQGRFRPTSREGQRLDSVTRSPIFALLSESVSGVETIRLARQQAAFCVRFHLALDQNSRVMLALNDANRWLGVRVESLGALLVLIVALLSIFTPHQSLSSALSGLLLSYAIALTGSMNWFVRSAAMTEASLTSYERILTYSRLTPERWQGSVEPPAGWPQRGELKIRDLSLRYRPSLPLALDRIRCEIPAGSRVGIVGRTGAGKSSLVLALLRLIEPESGYVELDGVNLATIGLTTLRRSITVVPQEPILLSGTVRENIDPLRRFSDTEIYEALRGIDLEHAISRLPRGLDTLVAEGGASLSSGERQLLCLARALLCHTKVIVLDEATANVDMDTDRRIQRALRGSLRGITLLVIAHRIETIADSDYILALRDGTLAEFDTPQALGRRRSSIFFELSNQLRTHSDLPAQRSG